VVIWFGLRNFVILVLCVAVTLHTRLPHTHGSRLCRLFGSSSYVQVTCAVLYRFYPFRCYLPVTVTFPHAFVAFRLHVCRRPRALRSRGYLWTLRTTTFTAFICRSGCCTAWLRLRFVHCRYLVYHAATLHPPPSILHCRISVGCALPIYTYPCPRCLWLGCALRWITLPFTHFALPV